jgi:hypothetical protein
VGLLFSLLLSRATKVWFCFFGVVTFKEGNVVYTRVPLIHPSYGKRNPYAINGWFLFF